MSAIAGIYNLDEEPVSIEDATSMMRALHKYPADDIRTWHQKNIFLGCHAQWITPESVGEVLPFYNPERQSAITADAIIDNRSELFERLRLNKTSSKRLPDSQLILMAYHKWGTEAPKYLIGEFAFMIWDERNKRLFGATDFCGSRTLYFNRSQWRFSFSTTMEPLFRLPYVEKRLNEQWLAEFLAMPDMTDTTDPFSTVYQKIEQVPPSHTITVSNDKLLISRYQSLTQGEYLHFKSNEEYVEAFREVFQAAVTDRLRTHQQVGAHLSGGLDSGSVVSFAAKALQKENKKLYTFSYVPPSEFVDWTPKYRIADETEFMKATVQYVGNIYDQYFDFKGYSPISEVDELLEMLEMPYKFFENSFWLKGFFEKARHEGIGVLLHGARGNFTISWGPALDFYATLLKKLKWIRLYNELNLYVKNTGAKKSRILSVVGKKALPIVERFFSQKDQYQFPSLINPEFAKRTDVFNKMKENGVDVTESLLTDVYQVRKAHFESSCSWNNNATAGTKLSLRYSLWNRDPTNDLRVVRFCLNVPEEQFVINGLGRALIRRSTETYLPDKVRLNQRIRGIQGADWVYRMTPSWNKFVQELDGLIKDPEIVEFLNIPVIKTALSNVREKPRPELAFDPECRILMRSLILYRFIKRLG